MRNIKGAKVATKDDKDMITAFQETLDKAFNPELRMKATVMVHKLLEDLKLTPEQKAITLNTVSLQIMYEILAYSNNIKPVTHLDDNPQ